MYTESLIVSKLAYRESYLVAKLSFPCNSSCFFLKKKKEKIGMKAVKHALSRVINLSCRALSWKFSCKRTHSNSCYNQNFHPTQYLACYLVADWVPLHSSGHKDMVHWLTSALCRKALWAKQGTHYSYWLNAASFCLLDKINSPCGRNHFMIKEVHDINNIWCTW